jgi:hypothetical protein
VRDKREDVRECESMMVENVIREKMCVDRKEDRRDKREDVRDRKEDKRDRRENVKDRKENRRDRREDVRDRKH